MRRKFGNEVFSKKNCLGSEIVFRGVIYSKKAKNDFCKYLKKSNKKKEYFENRKNIEDFYNRYYFGIDDSGDKGDFLVNDEKKNLDDNFDNEKKKKNLDNKNNFENLNDNFENENEKKNLDNKNNFENEKKNLENNNNFENEKKNLENNNNFENDTNNINYFENEINNNYFENIKNDFFERKNSLDDFKIKNKNKVKIKQKLNFQISEKKIDLKKNKRKLSKLNLSIFFKFLKSITFKAQIIKIPLTEKNLNDLINEKKIL